MSLHDWLLLAPYAVLALGLLIGTMNIERLIGVKPLSAWQGAHRLLVRILATIFLLAPLLLAPLGLMVTFWVFGLPDHWTWQWLPAVITVPLFFCAMMNLLLAWESEPHGLHLK